MIELKDYLHYYLGCRMLVGKGAYVDNSAFMLARHLDTLEKDNALPIKLFLRPLSDMTGEEAEYLAWLCMDSKHAPYKAYRIDMDEIQTNLIKNDGGNMLDAEIEIYIEISCRFWEGYLAIRKNGSISLCAEESEKLQPIDEIADKIHYLLSKYFDLFGLIDAGLAIDKTKSGII